MTSVFKVNRAGFSCVGEAHLQLRWTGWGACVFRKRQVSECARQEAISNRKGRKITLFLEMDSHTVVRANLVLKARLLPRPPEGCRQQAQNRCIQFKHFCLRRPLLPGTHPTARVSSYAFIPASMINPQFALWTSFH